MVEEAFKSRRLATRMITAEAGKVYEPDRDVRMHFLTVSGSAEVKIDNEPPTICKPFHELIIGKDQLHQATVGPEGWEYIVAWNEEEAK
jgi:hypothetical protein